MKKFLIPLIISLSYPSVTYAQNATLVLTGYVNGSSIAVIPMRDIDQCEEQGAIWMASKRARFDLRFKGYECLESR